MPTLNPYVRSKQKAQYARVCPVCETHFVTRYNKKECCTKKCTDIRWRREHPECVRIISAARVRREDGLDHPQPDCDCHDYKNCMCCRNAERRRAFKAGEIPAYRLTQLQTLASVAGD